jgi:xanthine/uracil/vitamin C permease (AzgA family)
LTASSAIQAGVVAAKPVAVAPASGSNACGAFVVAEAKASSEGALVGTSASGLGFVLRVEAGTSSKETVNAKDASS